MENLDNISVLLLSIITLFGLIQLAYYGVLYNGMHRHHVRFKKGKQKLATEFPPLSVIIYAKNEAEDLKQNLPFILEQDYPNFEVIVIDDASTDHTEAVLDELGRNYKHLRKSFTPESARYISHKKLALTLGVKASKHEWLVFTEANCKPASNEWLRLMAGQFTPETEIVLGYHNYEFTKKGTSKLMILDSLFFSLRYLGFALIGKPYLGIGRNLAYRKGLFFKQKGYSSHLYLRRGEDDLFINRAATKTNTRVETASQAAIQIVSSGKQEWKEEKINRTVTSQCYKGRQRYVLGFETFSRLVFHTVCLASLVWFIMQSAWIFCEVTAVVWLIRYACQAIIINQTAKELGEKNRFYLLLPFFDVIQPIQSLFFNVYRVRYRKSDFFRK